jgi:3,4-dehydroadipyl-CoA semialdehyde dehydrogenase
MRELSSYLQGQWVQGDGTGRDLHDAVNGDVIARASTRGLDLAAAVGWARDIGGQNLRALTFAERGAILRTLSKIIVEKRDELIAVSTANYGATRRDAKFDIDGASGTLSYYAYLGKQLGDRNWLVDGEAESLMRSKRFVGQHLQVSRPGLAIHINAFNFPCWGMAEKLAVAVLAGVPVFSKPATSTAWVAEELARVWVETGALPQGAFSFLAGSVGDLLDHVDVQDCLAFTGSGSVGTAVRGHAAVVKNNVRVNIEADSLNASVLGPDVTPDSDTWQMWLNDIVRDLQQKAGQKCTCVRRIFVPVGVADDAIEALVDRLGGAKVGDPTDRATDLGPLSTPAQKRDVVDGIARLKQVASLVFSGDAPETGCFLAPHVFRSDEGVDAPFVHEEEVFGPIATVLPWAGDAEGAIALVAKGRGTLVSSIYSNDVAWSRQVLLGIAPWTGRVMWGSRKVHDQSPGPGTVLPNLVHGGPGKAGGGEELGGMRGMGFYMQRTAIQADRSMLERALKE